MKLFKNISYSLFSNFLSILVSTIIVLIIPKFIGVHEYGLWQIFIFYANYIGMLHLGWADGLFLRKGGTRAQDIDVSEFKSESMLFIAFNLIIGLLILIFGAFVAKEYTYIIFMLSIAVTVVNTRTWITMLLQSVGNFKSYAINLSVQSLVYLFLIMVIIFSKIIDYKLMIAAFIISQMATSISGYFQIKKILTPTKTFNFKLAKLEAYKNLSAGYKLMVANSTSMLIVGIIRFGIQQKWSINVFGKVSLVLSIANLITVFINAVSLVLFPTLRRTKQIATDVYTGIREVLMPLLYLIMILYYPIRLLIPIWLPKYADAAQYVAVLMPMMVYQGKFEILSNTFMKNFRMESVLMKINILTLGLSVLMTGVMVYYLHNLSLTIFTIGLVMGFRSNISEIILSKKMGIRFASDLLFENIIIIGFMIINWNGYIYVSFVLFLMSMISYGIAKKSNIKKGIVIVRELSRY